MDLKSIPPKEKVELLKISLKFHKMTIQGAKRVAKNPLASYGLKRYYLNKMNNVLSEISKIIEYGENE